MRECAPVRVPCREVGKLGEGGNPIHTRAYARVHTHAYAKTRTCTQGPFKQEFRNADSTWSLATKEELEAGLAWLQAKIDAGEGEKFLAEREAIRAKIGQTTTVITRKAM